MSQQSYKNHVRWYPPHHFVFYPVMLGLIIFSTYKSYNDEAMRELWVTMTVVFICITWLAFMLRQHYALTLQNRLVLTELRYRYLATTGNRLEPLEEKLSEGQLFALRFAPDDQLQGLAERAVKEKLTPDEIKRSIQAWKPDHKRV